MTAAAISIPSTRMPGIFRRFLGFVIQYRAFKANHHYLSHLSEQSLRKLGLERHQVGETAWAAGERERDIWLKG